MEKQSKFKSGLYKTVKEETAFKENQQKLKKKYQINKPDVVVVEKTNMTKFLIRLLIGFIKFAATTAILILAVIGLLTLIYPQIRAEFISVWLQITAQFLSMI